MNRSAVLEALSTSSRWEEATHIEEQSYVDTSAGRLFTTSLSPRAGSRGLGFLICHSFAWEQAELYALELIFGRMAAAAGFPVLSFHANGYGDTGGAFEEVTLATQSRDAVSAGEVLASMDGVDRVVTVGARWGAAVATIAAGELGAPAVAMWGPSLEPGRYLDGLLKVKSMAGMVDGGGSRLADMKEALRSGGIIDLIGYPLTADCYRHAHETDPLVHAVARALLVGVNPAHRRQVERGAERLRAVGCEVEVQDAEGEGRSTFGLGMPLSGHLATNRSLFEDIARRTIAWAEALP